MHKRGELGRRGEEAAAGFLERRGYSILARNFHSRYGELDLVAAKGDTIAFVEVKTRRTTSYGFPAAAVTYTKQKKLRTTALVYLAQQDTHYEVLSFDVIEVWVEGATAKIHWLPSCF